MIQSTYALSHTRAYMFMHSHSHILGAYTCTQTGMLANTVVVIASDHGFHWNKDKRPGFHTFNEFIAGKWVVAPTAAHHSTAQHSTGHHSTSQHTNQCILHR